MPGPSPPPPSHADAVAAADTKGTLGSTAAAAAAVQKFARAESDLARVQSAQASDVVFRIKQLRDRDESSRLVLILCVCILLVAIGVNYSYVRRNYNQLYAAFSSKSRWGSRGCDGPMTGVSASKVAFTLTHPGITRLIASDPLSSAEAQFIYAVVASGIAVDRGQLCGPAYSAAKLCSVGGDPLPGGASIARSPAAKQAFLRTVRAWYCAKISTSKCSDADCDNNSACPGYAEAIDTRMCHPDSPIVVAAACNQDDVDNTAAFMLVTLFEYGFVGYARAVIGHAGAVAPDEALSHLFGSAPPCKDATDPTMGAVSGAANFAFLASAVAGVFGGGALTLPLIAMGGGAGFYLGHSNAVANQAAAC